MVLLFLYGNNIMPLIGLRSISVELTRKPNGGTISAASFSSSTVQGSITIGSITGSFASYVVGRTGGSQGTYTSTAQTGASFTDPTALTNNVQYTYTITPNGGTAFTNIINPNNGGTPGRIFTAASTSGLTLTYNGGGCAVNVVSFTYTGSSGNYTTLSFQYPNGTQVSTGTYSTGGQTYTSGAVFATNTQYLYYVYAKNGDGLQYATGTTINTCTWASTNTPTFSSTTSTGTTLACTGTFSKVYVTFSGGSASPASGTTITGTNSISQAYTSMASGTAYTFVCYPVNVLNYQSPTSTSANVTTTAVVVNSSAAISGTNITPFGAYDSMYAICSLSSTVFPTVLAIHCSSTPLTITFGGTYTATVFIIAGGMGGSTGGVFAGAGGNSGSAALGSVTFNSGQTYTFMAGNGSQGYVAGTPNANGVGTASVKAYDSWIAIGNVTSATLGGGSSVVYCAADSNVSTPGGQTGGGNANISGNSYSINPSNGWTTTYLATTGTYAGGNTGSYNGGGGSGIGGSGSNGNGNTGGAGGTGWTAAINVNLNNLLNGLPVLSTYNFGGGGGGGTRFTGTVGGPTNSPQAGIGGKGPQVNSQLPGGSGYRGSGCSGGGGGSFQGSGGAAGASGNGGSGIILLGFSTAIPFNTYNPSVITDYVWRVPSCVTTGGTNYYPAPSVTTGATGTYMTISFWLNSSGNGQNAYYFFFGNSTTSCIVGVKNITNAAAANNYTNIGKGMVRNGGDNSTNHYTFIRQIGTTTSTTVAYIDGVSKGTISTTSLTSANLLLNYCCIGGAPTGTLSGTPGTFSDFRVYNRALTDSEVKLLAATNWP